MLEKVKNFFSACGKIFTVCGEILTATFLALRAIKNFSQKHWWWISWIYLTLLLVIIFFSWEWFRWTTY
jgi:hypothetical protein